MTVPSAMMKSLFAMDTESLWIHKYRPYSTADLAVHSKKIEEVILWKDSVKSDSSEILLITGPTGCGKSSTIYALPKVTVETWHDTSGDLENFADFLFNTSRYSHLDDESKLSFQKILLIESFPNQCNQDPQPLHDILMKYKSIGKCPLVIIISDSQSFRFSHNFLIPSSLQKNLCIKHIAFNPIAHTLLKKALKSIILKETRICGKEWEPILNEISSQSGGDIRNAINNLQMIMKGGKGQFINLNMIKDTRLFVFHALGKILYSKRETDVEKIKNSKASFKSFDDSYFRPPLTFNPEDVFSESGLTHSDFVNYVHENFIDFSENIDDVDTILNDMSLAESVFGRWSGDYQDLLGKYLVSTVSRSFIFHNNSPAKHAWRAFRKSGITDLYRNTQSLRSDFKNLFEWDNSVVSLMDCLNINEFIQFFSLKSVILQRKGLGHKIPNDILQKLRLKRPLQQRRTLEEGVPVLDDDKLVLQKNAFKRKLDDDCWTVCRMPDEDNVFIEIEDD